MRGPAAPTSPGAWDARSEALLGAPAVDAEPTPPAIAPGPAGPLPTLDLHADPPPPGPAPAPGLRDSALDDLLSAFGPPRHPAAPPADEAQAAADAEPEAEAEPEAATVAQPEADVEPEPEP
ncbi:hypothetical protein AB1388_40235, partial [Streptomyces hydrogenans]